jgi:hypothetical protein
MFHPSILAQVTYRRTEHQARLADACTDAAQFYGIAWGDVGMLIEFCRRMGV